ncbi:MAG TPA: hypothetical protein PKI12_04680, partial [Bacteroidales bacterium]|nr:hypothetical protein [Bacteroidales bacterium]
MKKTIMLISALMFSLLILNQCRNNDDTDIKTGAGIKPVDLTCEYLKDPVVIDTQNPRLSWI